MRAATTRRALRQRVKQTTGEAKPLLSSLVEEQPYDPADDDRPGSPFTKVHYEFGHLPVYDNIWRIRQDVQRTINDTYSNEQLRSPRLNIAVVRPLLVSYYEKNDISIVYCLLVNRMQFLREQSYAAHYQSVNTSRAILCEILALKLLRQWDEDSTGRRGLLLLAKILIAGFEPFQGAPPSLTLRRRSSNPLKPGMSEWASSMRTGSERYMTALEIAIISQSKMFLSSPSCQKVVDAIYIGRITYTPTTFIDIIPDHYKYGPIKLYNPRKSQIFNQYRLSVPRTRSAIEILQFAILLGLYLWVMSARDVTRFATNEIIFCVYTCGWILDQFASVLEHGWYVYSQNLHSFLDVAFCFVYTLYFSIRMHSLAVGGDEVTAELALDVLAMSAPFLIPRMAFNLWSENLLFVSLRDMMAKFVVLICFAVWTFAGFFLSMLWLSETGHKPELIGEWMVWVWFGLDGTPISQSAEFHPIFGPILWVTFAILGNTLFLTVIVSTLTDTFANINRHSAAEIQFRRAVFTFEGVKVDSLFSYFPPTNLVAVVVLLPLKFFCTPRWFHKINVTLIRIVNAPLLVMINIYERITLGAMVKDFIDASKGKFGHRSIRYKITHFARWRVHGDIEAVFDKGPDDFDNENDDNDSQYYDEMSDEEASRAMSEDDEAVSPTTTALQSPGRSSTLQVPGVTIQMPAEQRPPRLNRANGSFMRRRKAPGNVNDQVFAPMTPGIFGAQTSALLGVPMTGMFDDQFKPPGTPGFTSANPLDAHTASRIEHIERVVMQIKILLMRFTEVRDELGNG